MIVNGVNILKSFNAILTERSIQAVNIETYNEWIGLSSKPIDLESVKVKTALITIELLIEGVNEDEILLKISNILSIVENSFELKFSDLSYNYYSSLKDHETENIYDKASKLRLILKSTYKLKDEVIESLNRITSKTFNVIGNQLTPAIVEITPSIDLIDLIITGLGEDPITIKNLKTNKKVIINGEDGTVTEEGVNKFNDSDLWDWPSLKPGTNTITVSKNSCNISIKYKPRYI